jgi:rhodanese-related sulfurtransferase
MKSYKDYLAEANAAVVTLTVAEAKRMLTDDEVLFVDLRDYPELERDGKLPGALHTSRGMLEFVVDPTSPYHDKNYSSGKHILFYCASGGRSALAAQRAQEMGLRNVAHIGGGIKAWKEAGGQIESV